MNGETTHQQPKGASTTEGLARAASTPPAAAKVLQESGSETDASPLGLLKMEARKSREAADIKSTPLQGDLIAPFIDLANCTRVEVEWDSVAALAIMRFGVKDFTVRSYDVSSWEPKPKKAKYESDSEDEDSDRDEAEAEDEDESGLHTRLNLGMGIHETVFKGEKVYLEMRIMDGPKTLMNNRCGVRVHNRMMAIFVEGVGRGDFVQEFLEDMILRIPVEDPPKKTRTEFEIYRWCHYDEYWRKSQTQKGRDLKSVILPKGMIEKVENDMTEFLSPETASWYELFGIPYKRSYLFHGVPGSGKTSLITALAGKLKRNVCFLSAHHPRFSDDAMKQAMERLPRRAFLIMEDIDSLFNQRTSMNSRSPLTFTGLLNCLDGIGHASGQIVIMTTNYIDRLDEALIRAGRADMWIEFKCATTWQLGELFKWFYHKTPEEAEKWKDTFVANCTAKFPEGVTIAEMQQHFVDCRTKTAQECAEGVKEYDMPTRKFTIGDKAKAKKELLEGKKSRDESGKAEADRADEGNLFGSDSDDSDSSDEDASDKKRDKATDSSDQKAEKKRDKATDSTDQKAEKKRDKATDSCDQKAEPSDASAEPSRPSMADKPAALKGDKEGEEFSVRLDLQGGVLTVTMAALFAIIATVTLSGFVRPVF